MGHVPPLPLPTSASMFLAWDESRLQREMRGRWSRLPWRRRRAYAACLTLIRAREAVLGKTADPWELLPPPKPERFPAAPTCDIESPPPRIGRGTTRKERAQ